MMAIKKERCVPMSASDLGGFALNPRLDVGMLAERFAASGRLQIAEFLVPESVSRLRSHLEQSKAWRHLLNSRDRSYEFASADWDALPEVERKQVLSAIDESAAYDFQYQYDTIRVDERAQQQAKPNNPLEEFAQFLSSSAVLQVLMRITGSNDLVFADCQATRYRPGDFLTPHNDHLDGMQRKFAYVLSLTPDWLPRWGGLLSFVDQTADVEATITPRFNALSLFAVGQSHYVSQVATYAPIDRISVTGWLRTQAPGPLPTGRND
jgi:Rps23 Pro-64 3,4-dihydroxylase Tpa1-like proline 4-hydroxylase